MNKKMPEEGLMNFDCALTILKGGETVARKSWDRAGVFVVKVDGFELEPYNSGKIRKVNLSVARLIGVGEKFKSKPYLALFDEKMNWNPGWIPSQEDMFAEDWFIV